jgi:hypothetical protein
MTRGSGRSATARTPTTRLAAGVSTSIHPEYHAITPLTPQAPLAGLGRAASQACVVVPGLPVRATRTARLEPARQTTLAPRGRRPTCPSGRRARTPTNVNRVSSAWTTVWARPHAAMRRPRTPEYASLVGPVHVEPTQRTARAGTPGAAVPRRASVEVAVRAALVSYTRKRIRNWLDWVADRLYSRRRYRLLDGYLQQRAMRLRSPTHHRPQHPEESCFRVDVP